MRVVLIAFSLIWAQASLAEVVGIRSAEHDGFTRVVIDTVRPQDITLQSTAKALEIKLPGSTTSVLAPDFFRRISRDRISQIETRSKNNKVVLRLACDCAAETSVQSGKMLILDIFEKAPEKTAALEPRTPFSPVRRVATLQFPGSIETTEKSAEPSERAPESSSSSDENIRLPRNVFDGTRAAGRSQIALENRLINALDASVRNKTGEGNSVKPARNFQDEQIAFRSLAKTQARAIPALEQDLEGAFQSCDGIDVLNPLNWPNSESAVELLNAKRSELHANETLTDAALRALSLTYLSLGMGAEAAQLIQSIPDAGPQDQSLSFIARLVDGETDFDTLPNSMSASCDELLVWQAFAGRRLTASEMTQARRDFDKWPQALRGIFAARFAEVLIRRDELDAASMVLRKSDRQPEMREGERTLVKAQLAELDKDEARAASLREGIVAQDLETAPEAAIALIEKSARNNAPPPDDLAAALESYRSERKGDPIEEDLLRASITSAIGSQNFAQAFLLLAEYAGMTRRSQVDMVLDEILTEVAKLPSDAQFLREAMSTPGDLFVRAGADIQAKIKSRIVQLGFSDLASQLGEGAPYQQIAAPGAVQELPDTDASRAAVPEARAGSQANDPDARSSDERASSDPTDDASAPRAGQPVPQAPLPEAIRATQSVLAEVEALRSELANLGLQAVQP